MADLNLQQISEALDRMEKKSQTSVQEINTRIETAVNSGATKAELLEIKEIMTKHGTDMLALNTFAEEFQKQAKQKKIEEKTKSFESAIENLVKDNHDKIVAGKGTRATIEFEDKDYNSQKDMSFTNNTTGQVIAQDFDRTIYGQPFQTPHIRTMIRIGRTSSNAYHYIKASLKSGVPTSVLPNGLKPEIQYQFDGLIAPVIKIAAHMRAPEEMLDDIDGITSYLQNYAPEEVLKVEDQQVLRGSGAPGNFDGIITQATVHVPSAGVLTTEAWDLLADAIAQQQNIWMPPTRGMVNPINWMFMATRKSTDGIYSHPTLIAGAPLTIAGMQIVPHPLILEDEYLIGDFTRAELKLRTGIAVRFFEQDRDNAILNMVTIVVEERAAFVVYYPDAFIKGDFGLLT